MIGQSNENVSIDTNVETSGSQTYGGKVTLKRSVLLEAKDEITGLHDQVKFMKDVDRFSPILSAIRPQ